MWHFCNVNKNTKLNFSNSLWNWSDQVNLRQLLIEYHIYIFVKIQNAIFKTNLDLASILSKQPKVGLNGDQLLHLGWRQAGPLRSHSVPSHTEDSLWLGARCWNCKDNPCHVGEKRKLAFVHLPPKQLGDSTVCIWQQFVAAPLLFKLALRQNLAYEISSLPYSRVLDYSTFEFTTLPYPTRSWKTTTRWGLVVSFVKSSSVYRDLQ